MVIIASIVLALIFGGVTYLIFNKVLIALFITVGAFVVLYYILVRVYDKDAMFIRDSLKIARKKTLQIQQYGRRWRMWRLWFKIRQIRKVNQEIITAIHKEPERFVKADKFFSLYLDSTLNVLEKYALLVQQPVRSQEVELSLKNSENMLDDIIKGLEQQLTSVLEADMMELEIEKEVIDRHTPR